MHLRNVNEITLTVMDSMTSSEFFSKMNRSRFFGQQAEAMTDTDNLL